MLVRDVYPMLENIYNLKGLSLIETKEAKIYLPEALEVCYFEYSNKEIKHMEYRDNHVTIYI